MQRQPPFGFGTSPKEDEINWEGRSLILVTWLCLIWLLRSWEIISGASVAEDRFSLKICCAGPWYPILAQIR